MKKNLILMSALFAGSMFMNNGFCANNGIPFDPTCDGVINYIMRENDNRAITLQLRNIAQNPNWLDGLPRGDKINLIYLIDTIESNERSPRGRYIDRIIDHLQAYIMPNDEVQNNAVDVVVNPAQDEGMEIEYEEDGHKDIRPQEVKERCREALAQRVANEEKHENNHTIAKNNQSVTHGLKKKTSKKEHIKAKNTQLAVTRGLKKNENGYLENYVNKIASKSKEKLHQDGEAVKPAIDYVKNNPVQSIGYAAGAVVMSTGAVTIAKKTYNLICYWLGYLGW